MKLLTILLVLPLAFPHMVSGKDSISLGDYNRAVGFLGGNLEDHVGAIRQLGAHQKYFTKTRWNYFVKYLRGVEPIWDFKWE